MSEDRFGFEEITYLLLFGKLPTAAELQAFTQQLSEYRTLPTNFVRDVIQKAPSPDMMNTLARSVLTLFSYDDNPFDLSVENVVAPVHTNDCAVPHARGVWLPGAQPL